jgi:hypothetical protein
MAITLLDDSLSVDIFFEVNDCEFTDNICVSILEDCPDDEKVFRGDETNLYLTRPEARLLAEALLKAAQESEDYCNNNEEDEKGSDDEKSLQA